MCYITTENTYTCNIKVLNARANRIDRTFHPFLIEIETQRKDITKTVSNMKLFIVYM